MIGKEGEVEETDLRYITTNCNAWTLSGSCFIQTNYKTCYEEVREIWTQNIDDINKLLLLFKLW